ncbi:MAG TPA: sensor histidine kinase [Gemmatimonadales bacterium]|jgi:hypothetical protein|nr:sensor histidine kinase [Gemmatimonadales bacterium]
MRADYLRRRARVWLLGLLAWTLLGLLSATQNATWRAYGGRPVHWDVILPVPLADWLTCGLFTPGFVWMAARFPIRGERWWAQVPAHLAASVAFVLLKVTLFAPILARLDPSDTATWSSVLARGFYADLLAYWAAVGVIHAIMYYRESRARQFEAMRLDHALRAAELENLRAQLQPHFLFNTLQSISTLLHRDPIAADRMLADLAGLLRLSLQHSAAQEVPLRDELAFLERYLDIMRTRLGDHVVITVEPEPEVLDAMVPSLVLQPLVENAIRHGLAGRSEQGQVGVRATRQNGVLHLEVWDDGPGLSALSAGERNGIGLTNTRERLSRLYGPKSSIETVAMPGRGHTVRVSVPYRTTP